MSNYIIIKEMAKVVCMQFADNGALKGVREVYKSPYLQPVKEVFQELYESYSEDYFIESWNDFVFSVPSINCIYVLRDSD